MLPVHGLVQIDAPCTEDEVNRDGQPVDEQLLSGRIW